MIIWLFSSAKNILNDGLKNPKVSIKRTLNKLNFLIFWWLVNLGSTWLSWLHLSKYEYLDSKYILFPGQALCPIKGSIILLQGGNALLNNVKTVIALENKDRTMFM